jgi:hypothetical protein
MTGHKFVNTVMSTCNTSVTSHNDDSTASLKGSHAVDGRRETAIVSDMRPIVNGADEAHPEYSTSFHTGANCRSSAWVERINTGHS